MIYNIHARYRGNIYHGKLDDDYINHEYVVDKKSKGSQGYGDCINVLPSMPDSWVTANEAEKAVTKHKAVKGWLGFWKFSEDGPSWKAGDSIQKLLCHIREQAKASRSA